jgi:phage-related baseplate assembly protein
MRALPPPEFVKIDPAAIEADLIARYEAKSGKVLYPAQIESLFIDQVAYAKTRILAAIQNAGEQLLVRFSSGPILDYLGELVDTPRLFAQPARCNQVFRIPEAAGALVTVVAGTRITSQDGRLVFTTEESVTIAIGQLEARTSVVCSTPGVIGNGWAIGQLAALPSPPVSGMTTANESVPADGTDDEGDEAYKERIILAPEAYSNAGSRGAYRYHVRAVHQSIIAVAVLGPNDANGPKDGQVALYPLTTGGLPSELLLEQLASVVTGEKVRPLCDEVLVLPPVEVAYTIRCALTLYRWAEATSSKVLAAAQLAAEAHATRLRAGFGIDIVPEQIIAALQVSGVYRPVLELPAVPRSVALHEWANCTAIELTIAGYSDE